jgi:PHD/YefM family antitoxin component YafN of YafNO toxin-antitoxin module
VYTYTGIVATYLQTLLIDQICSNMCTLVNICKDIVMITTLTSREFNQQASKAKQAAEIGPVFITDRGKPAHVLLSFDAYQHLTKQRHSIAEALALDIGDSGFAPLRLIIQTKPVDFL